MKNALTTGVVILACSLSASAAERAAALHSDIEVAASGELVVTETLEIQSPGRNAASGVTRAFAESWRDRQGLRRRTEIVVERVLRNGRPEPYQVQAAAAGTQLRTGEAGRALPRGKHVYEIRYRASGRIAHYEAHDELYWNVGGGWRYAFERLSAEVRFERPVAAQDLRIEGVTGAPGTRGEDYHAFVREGSAAFRATRALAPNEALTLLVAFPKELVAAPSALERSAGYAYTHPGAPLGAGFFAAMLALLTACWWRFGRIPAPQPAPGEPPPGVGPGGVRFIERRRYDERCLMAALAGLEARGALAISSRGERLRFEGRDIEPGFSFFPGEEALVDGLLGGARAELRRGGRALEEAGRRFSQALWHAFARREWLSHGGFVLAAAGLAGTGVLAMVALETPSEAIAVVAGAMLLALLVFSIRLVPVLASGGARHRPAIAELRAYFASTEPINEEAYLRLMPYAVALELENVWGRRFAQRLPDWLSEPARPVRDRASARPTRPLRHTRSAAA